MVDLSYWLNLPRKFRGYLRDRPSRRARPRRLEIDLLEERVVPTLLGQQLFPADYPWNQNIANAPVAANSAAIIAHIGSSIKIHPDWGQDSASNGSSPLYGIPYNVVHGNATAKINVIIDNYPGESDVVPVPIPSGAVIEGDYQNGPNPNGGGYNSGQRGDSHLIVWDEDNNVAYELYGVTRPSDPTLFPNTSGVELSHTDGQWHAAQESVWQMNGDGFRPLGDTSADAAGLSILAGLARPDEGVPAPNGQGAITHALRFTLPSGDVNPQYLYPASHVVNDSSGSTKLPFGARLRLMNTPAVNSLISGMGPEAQSIAHAMQQYGLILADIGSAMYVTGTSAAQNASNQICLTWNMSDVLGLAGLNAGDFQVIDLTPRVTSLSASSGSAGNTITVIGQNYSGAAGHLSVFFGSTPATSVTFVDDSHLKVVVPNGSGTVHVTVQSGVNETDPNNPKDNVTNPIFGYGVSTAGTADQFTYAQLSGYHVTLPGGSTVPAGKGFAVGVQAIDQFGNPITSYSGPSSVTASLSPGSAGSSFPVTVPIGPSGFGLFLGRVQQAGSYTLQVASGSLTGSAGVTITPGPAVKLAFATQPASTPTGVVLPPVSVQVLDLYGNVVTTDSSDFVTLGVASGPGGTAGFVAGSTLTAPVQNGLATFNNLKLANPGSYTLGAVVAGKYTGPNSAAFTIAPLQVVPGSFAGTPTGFAVRFNGPFLVNASTPSLYGPGPALASSVLLTTDPGNLGDRAALVGGSLLLDPANDAITFLATDTALEADNGSPVLPDGTYTVIVRASAVTNGIQALNPGGGFLDGLGTGTPGSGDFTTTFTVNASALQDDVVWLPATADGPGQPLRAPGDNQAGAGYPLLLSDRTGKVTDVQATLTYDPTLLNVTPSNSSTFTVTVPTPGTAVLHYSGPALTMGSRTVIGLLTAAVPAGTAANPIPYKARDLLHLAGVSLNGGGMAVTSSDALHLVAYVGDADGNGSYSSNDAVLITRVALQADSGFAAYPLVDPVIVADTDGAGFIPADAALQVNEAGVGYPTANLAIPPIPPNVYLQPMASNNAAELALAGSEGIEEHRAAHEGVPRGGHFFASHGWLPPDD